MFIIGFSELALILFLPGWGGKARTWSGGGTGGHVPPFIQKVSGKKLFACDVLPLDLSFNLLTMCPFSVALYLKNGTDIFRTLNLFTSFYIGLGKSNDRTDDMYQTPLSQLLGQNQW